MYIKMHAVNAGMQIDWRIILNEKEDQQHSFLRHS